MRSSPEAAIHQSCLPAHYAKKQACARSGAGYCWSTVHRRTVKQQETVSERLHWLQTSAKKPQDFKHLWPVYPSTLASFQEAGRADGQPGLDIRLLCSTHSVGIDKQSVATSFAPLCRPTDKPSRNRNFVVARKRLASLFPRTAIYSLQTTKPRGQSCQNVMADSSMFMCTTRLLGDAQLSRKLAHFQLAVASKKHGRTHF